jgi:epoxyqueuosine reductase
MKSEIYRLAYESLIDEVRFIDADDFTTAHVGDLAKFVGRHPRDILPGAKSIIVFSNYIGMFETENSPTYGRTSRLVLSGYYANIVSTLLPIVNYLEDQGYTALVSDGEIDEESIPLKGAAVKAGLGWIGKNTLLISKRFGSFQALGAIITDADIGEENRVAKNYCGKCTKCVDSCPTNAIKKPHILDMGSCLSDILEGYNTGSDLAEIPAFAGMTEGTGMTSEAEGLDSGTTPGMTWGAGMTLRAGITDGYFFECDICQNVCPWNQKHMKKPLDTPFGRKFEANKLNPIMEIEHLKSMDKETYEKEIAPLIIGFELPYETFKRNLKLLNTVL